MSRVFFQLIIESNADKHPAINSLLGVTDAKKKEHWCYEIIIDELPVDIPQATVPLHFMSILDGKYEELNELGIKRSDIMIYIIYEYDVECNLEFLPDELLLMGQNKIVLAVSCYRS